jgi:hypothetical protein
MVRRSEKPVSAERSVGEIQLKKLGASLAPSNIRFHASRTKNEIVEEKTSWCPPSCFETTSHEETIPKNAVEI